MNKKTLFRIFLIYINYLISFLFIRSRKRYTFGGPNGTFKDNAKYLFIYTSEHTDIDVAWVTTSRMLVSRLTALGLNAYHVRSFRGIWHALTSKYWFYNSYLTDIDFCLSGGATTINLWHGVGIKCIERNMKGGPLAELRKHPTFDYWIRHPHQYIRPSYVLSSNPFQSVFFASSFDIPQSHCLEFGYPRNWILKATEDERTRFMKKYEIEETCLLVERIRNVEQGGYSKVLIYMPTWRDSQCDKFAQSMDFERLNRVLRDRNELLLLKPHPEMIVRGSDSDYSNIVLINSMIDVYSILPYVQVLITDYSSVIYDFLIMPPATPLTDDSISVTSFLDRSVILYIYDYEEYIKNDRELYYPYDENVVGRRVYDFEQLLKVISEGDYALSTEDRQYLVDRFWGESQYYNSNQKILDFVKSL